MDKTEKLSSREYWDDILSKAKLPVKVNRKQYSPWLIDSFFREFVAGGSYKTLLEAGAGSSAWLPYLAEEYSLVVSGLDYSELGCRICEENLKILGTRYDEIICRDIFKWDSGKKYDIIISLGLVEHFENPEDILGIIGNHINPGGVIITVIPNLIGLSGQLTKMFLPDVYNIHKRITRNDLKAMHDRTGFHCLKNDYTGFFYPMIIPWSVKIDGFCFKKGSSRRRIILKIIELKNALITKILRSFRIRMSSSFFSPFIIYVGRLDSKE